MELGYLRAEWVAGDDAFGMSPTFREGLAALGMRYVLDVPGGTTVWPLDPAWTSPEYPGFGRPRKPKLRPGQRRTMEQRGENLSETVPVQCRATSQARRGTDAAVSNAPEGTTLETLAYVGGSRWRIETE